MYHFHLESIWSLYKDNLQLILLPVFLRRMIRILWLLIIMELLLGLVLGFLIFWEVYLWCYHWSLSVLSQGILKNGLYRIIELDIVQYFFLLSNIHSFCKNSYKINIQLMVKYPNKYNQDLLKINKLMDMLCRWKYILIISAVYSFQ